MNVHGKNKVKEIQRGNEITGTIRKKQSEPLWTPHKNYVNRLTNNIFSYIANIKAATK